MSKFKITLKDILHKYIKNDFIKSVAILTAGNVIGQIINILSIPIIARIYSEEDYGEFAVLTAVVSILVSFVALGLNSAIMAPKEDVESKKLFVVNFIISLTLTFVVMIVFITISPWYKIVNVDLNYVIVCIYIFISVVCLSLVNILTIYFNRLGNNKVLFVNSLINAFINLIITLPLGLLGFGVKGFMIASVITASVRIVQMLKVESPFRTKIDFNDMKYVVKKYKHYVFFQYPSNFIGNYSIQLPMTFFSNHFGNVLLGGYSMCERILGIPSRFLADPISNIYFRKATNYFNESKSIAPFTFKFTLIIMAISILPVLLISIWGQDIFSFVLSEKWRSAGRFAAYLSIQYVFAFIATCTAYCRVSLQKQKFNFFIQIFKFIIIVLIILLIKVKGYNIESAVIVLALGWTLFYIMDMASNFYCMGRKSLMYKYITLSSLYSLLMYFIIFKTNIC